MVPVYTSARVQFELWDPIQLLVPKEAPRKPVLIYGSLKFATDSNHHSPSCDQSPCLDQPPCDEALGEAYCGLYRWVMSRQVLSMLSEPIPAFGNHHFVQLLSTTESAACKAQ